MAVIVLGTLLVLISAFLRLGIGASRQHNAAMDDARAFYIAEAGIAEAGAAIISGKSGNVGTAALPASYGNGMVWVVSTDIGGGDHRLESTALCDSGRAALRVVVHATPAVSNNQAITSDLPLVIPSNFLLDSYDPALGTYASQPKKKYLGHNDLIVNAKAAIGSNQGIKLTTNDRIYGDATPGPGYAVSGIGGNTFVTGSTLPATKPVTFPPVTVPAVSSSGAKTVKKTDPVAARTTGPGDFHYSSLTINTQAAYVIKGPANVVIDSLTTTAGCTFAIDATGGPVNVFFTGPAVFVSNMTVTSTAPTARSVSLLFSSTLPTNLSSNAAFIGTIYAPFSTVTVSSNWVNYGAITAHGVVLSSNLNMHFDESLLGVSRAARTALTVKDWQKIAVPQALMSHDRVDPYKLLGIAPGSLPRSSDAYQ
jgi:hypothetical protein